VLNYILKQLAPLNRIVKANGTFHYILRVDVEAPKIPPQQLQMLVMMVRSNPQVILFNFVTYKDVANDWEISGINNERSR
jgi:hypothetical protein